MQSAGFGGGAMRSAGVIADLATWGPDSTAAVPSIDDARAYCKSLATSHYENFTVVSWLLPRSLRQHMFNVYAFCRWADDLGDETGDPARSAVLLAWWRRELERCFAGEASHPVYVALSETIREFSLDSQPFHDLISAFEQDQRVREYGTFEQLLDYCGRSANPVGRIVLSLFRASAPQRVEWSDSICTGLQLANFWQDVARDHAIGRVYLPREDRLRFAYTDDDLAEQRTTPGFIELMKFEVDRAREYLNRGRPLASSVRGRLRIDVELFMGGGLRILDEIERIGYRVWETRPEVSNSAKLSLLVRSVALGLNRR
jgi:squalene synthase HpnC